MSWWGFQMRYFAWNWTPGHTRVVQIGPSGRIFFRPQTLTFGSFAVFWATRMHSISFEIPDTGAIEFLTSTLTFQFRSIWATRMHRISFESPDKFILPSKEYSSYSKVHYGGSILHYLYIVLMHWHAISIAQHCRILREDAAHQNLVLLGTVGPWCF